ncbi:MAG: efflux RND transporter periplasmic adaptor subunit, partial [Acetobacteraceae bacterium]|nr:efflux RND transporter periplasmic adaptor subunit [Acetobacteraceae bacterium]MBV8590716.1 efflux RND transporter periplasmic adaptor subunit [Acetobacteraceae bacterium]
MPATRSRRLRTLAWIGLLILLGAGAYWLWSTHTGPQGGGPGRNAQGGPQSVGAGTASTGDIRIIFNALGTVTSLSNVTVKTQLSGYLMEIGFTEGQVVKKGDFLAQVDPRPYQALLEQAEGQLARDQALLKQAQTNLARYQTLLKQDSIARQQAEDQAFLVQQYRGAIIVDQAQIDTQKLNIAYCRIVAPADGRVGLRQVDAGNYVQ